MVNGSATEERLPTLAGRGSVLGGLGNSRHSGLVTSRKIAKERNPGEGSKDEVDALALSYMVP